MNRLADATSPYLLQHAGNPVDWYEWGSDALDRAKREDKPILLSIGYAACHWCHVMAHESFEDPGTAAIMNEHFVCVKVDREERPDLDSIYMDAVQAMTGSGGWPMTVFLTPDGEPFYAGTYFPPEDRHGLPGFPRLLLTLAETWRERRNDVLSQSARVVLHLSQAASPAGSPEPLTEELLRGAHAAITASFDREWGGFGGAPKFPQPMTLGFLLGCHLRGYAGALEMVTTTLDRMADGGIHDQVGGGFHRYSTDGRWLVPHFEKMLYDNAQLGRLYLHAWQVTGNERYRSVVVSTLDYLLREMRHQDGGFFSAQDADSEGEEGRYFVWSFDELVRTAGEHGEAVAAYFGARPDGNWEGRNVLWTPRQPDGWEERFGLGTEALLAAVEAGRERLFEERSSRVRPATDDKVLASWNGLAIQAFAEAGRVLGEQRYVRAAEGAAGFVLSEMRREDGRLLRAWRQGRTSGPGYADDHAMMAAACLTLYETTFDLRWIREARALADDLVRLFHDPDRGGFFQTGSDAEGLVIRPKELFDNAVPSGNSVAAEVLQRLAHLTGDQTLERIGVSALRVTRDLMLRAPSAFGHALSAVDLYLGTATEVAVVGEVADEETKALVREVWDRFLPNVVLAAGPPGDGETAAAVPLLADRPLVDGKPAAYVCERFTCQRPVVDPADLAAQLAG
ncbi:MAG TPA: thioredoxin domain-containing protein [Actinomycetota bacterium]|nr:thioredoxin domain-containing protein [Actinomycetota bacterium]